MRVSNVRIVKWPSGPAVRHVANNVESTILLSALLQLYHEQIKTIADIRDVLDNWDPSQGFNWKVRDELRCILYGADHTNKPSMPRDSNEYESERTK